MAPSRIARRYLPLALLLAVAAYQMWRVEVDGLTRWRGGGFGMYSSVHYGESEVWIGFSRGEGLNFVPMTTAGTVEARLLLPRCRVFPTEESLEELALYITPGAGALQIWRPRLDPETLAFDRELLAEYRR